MKAKKKAAKATPKKDSFSPAEIQLRRSSQRSLILGIDNGTSGGMAAIDMHSGELHGWATLPVNVTGGESRIYPIGLGAAIKALVGTSDFIAVVEVCPMHADRADIMRSMGISFGIIYAALQFQKCPSPTAIRYVKSGNSKDSWQRRLLSGGQSLPSGMTKPLALAKAQELWPDESWIPLHCSTPDTGIIDAALIAEFYRTQTHKPA